MNKPVIYSVGFHYYVKFAKRKIINNKMLYILLSILIKVSLVPCNFQLLNLVLC
jgi:hypothetical protein